MAKRLPIPEAFREPSFSMFFAGQVASNVGTWFQNLALSLILLEVTGQAQSLSAVSVAQFTPILLLSIVAGKLADRVSPKVILLVTSAGSALTVLAISMLVVDVSANFALILALISVLGTCNTFERVAAQALIPRLVDHSLLGRAVASYTMALSVARSIGPGLAGIVFASFGGQICLQINAASYLLVLLSIVFVRMRPREAAPAGKPLRLRDLRHNRWFVTIVLTNALIALLALNLLIILTSFVTLTFDGGAAETGLVHALNAVGAIIGGLIASSRQGFGPRLLAIACVCLSVAYLANALAPSLLVVLLLSPLLGAAHGLYQGTLHAAAQSAVPRALIGRAMGLMTMLQYGVTPIGAIIVGIVIDTSSASTALLISSGATLLAAAMIVLRSRVTPPRRS